MPKSKSSQTDSQASGLTRREVCGMGAAAFAQGGKASKPNIVIFFVDELRATALRLYHPDGLETPNLARLASRGVLFNNAFTPHPLCMPARASLWTGQYSHTHGSRCNVMHTGKAAYLHDDRETMAGVLHDAGYRTGIFGKNHTFTPEQLTKWFDVDYSYPANDPSVPGGLNKGLSPEDMAQVTKHHQWILHQAGRPSTAPFPPEIMETYLANQRGMEFIEREAGKPFAAWISILAPHGPIETTEPYAHTLPPEKVKLPPTREGEMKNKGLRFQIYNEVMHGDTLPESYLRNFLSIYEGMVACIDHELGRTMALLESKGLLDNTIFIFSSDHGDYAGEHHLVYKSGSLVDCMVRIPLVISWPGHVAQGKREEALVNQIDLMPTLLDFCGLKTPAGVEGQRLPFRAEDPRRTFVYSEYGAGEPDYTFEHLKAARARKESGSKDFWDTEQGQQLTRERAGHIRMIRTATHKFVLDSNGDIEFYDLVKDPYELDNAHGRPEYHAIEQELGKKLA